MKTYLEIVLEDGKIKTKPLDYDNMKKEEKNCYYIVDQLDGFVLMSNITYAVLSNQN